MNAFAKDIQKATQLTRAGRLKDALAAIRAALGAKPAALAGGLPGRRAPRPDTPAPDTQAPGARFESRSFTGGAGQRGYKLFIPATLAPAPKLIIMLHGCTQNPDDFATGTAMNDIAAAEGFLVAYPAQPASANMQKCWNWFSPADQHRGAGEPAIIAGITQHIAAEFNIGPGRIFAAGLSAGGAMAATLGAAYPDLFAAIGIHSGLPCGAAKDMTSAFKAMQRGGDTARETPITIPTIVFHGTADHTVNPINADQIIASAQPAPVNETTSQGQAGGQLYTRTIQTGPGGKPVTEKWLIQGAGHAWSGGNAAGSFATPSGPNASREMVRFFNETARQDPRHGRA